MEEDEIDNIFEESEIQDLEGYENAREIFPKESEEQEKGESTFTSKKQSNFVHLFTKIEVEDEDDEDLITDEEEEEECSDYDEEEYRKKLSLSIRNSEFLFEDSLPVELEKRPASITNEEISKVVETILGYEHDNEEAQGRAASFLREKKRPATIHIPHILETTPVRKIPFSADDAFKCLEDQVKRMKELKNFDQIQSQQNLNKLHAELTKWKSNNPSTASTLSKQLALEIFTNAFVHHRVSKLRSSLSEILESKLIPMKEIYNKLISNPNFNQYLTPSNTQSIKKTLKMCFVSASNAINRFETSYKSAMEIIEQLENILEELMHTKGEQCKSLSEDYGQHFNALSSKCTSLDSLELVSDKKDFYWLLSKPYHKNEFGCRAPKWEIENFLPFSFEKVRQSAWRDYELDNLKVAIVETVIQTRISRIKNRYNQLLMKFHDFQEKHEEDVLFQLCRSKYHFIEQPSKSSSSSLSIYKPYPVVDLSNRNFRNNLPIGMKVQLVLDPKKLERWRNQSIAKFKKITLKDIAKDSSIHINWTRVAGKMGKTDNFTNRTTEDCQRTWEKLLRPLVLNDYEWTRSQITMLMDAVQKHGDRNWDLVAKELGSTFTSFQCFYTYERLNRPSGNQNEKVEKLKKLEELGSFGFSQIVELSREFTPEMTRDKYVRLATKFTEVMTDIPNTPNFTTLAESYNRFNRPDLVKGEFQIVEDLILLVCMVKMRDYLKEAKTFSPLRNYLPWRFVSTWTNRAETIFRPWRSAWTREEDLLLLSLVESHQKPDWSLFCTYFDVTKNRKNTRSRYLLLQEKLKYMSFDEFCEEYQKTSPHVKSQTKLFNLLTQLKIVLDLPKSPVPSAEKLLNPSELDLWNYLTSFDNSWIQQTISDLELCYESVDLSLLEVSKEIQFQEPPVKKSKTLYFDRRRLIRGDPESTASAIHLRKLTLIPPEEADPVTPFEEKVYKYFDHFKDRAVKARTEHKNIPDARVLIAMPEIHRIIQQNYVNDSGGGLIEPDSSISLNEDGFPIITDELSLPISKRKSKQDLRKDRKERMMKLNEELAKKRANKTDSVVND